LDALCEVVVEDCTAADLPLHAGALEDVQILFSGWGCPLLDAATLDLMPRLEAVFYGAGTVKDVVTDAFWERDIPIASGWAANAVPVAEFAVAQIILSLKQVWGLPGQIRRKRRFDWPEGFNDGGAFGTQVALISLGQIGQRVARMLQAYDLEVLACDPFCPPGLAAELGVRLTDLATCFAEARVVSLHSPLKPETNGLIDAALLRRMPLGATLINTARGGLIHEADLAAVLRQRPELTALLDVTDPEPPAPESPLYDLENVFITPHVAGSIGAECGRMGHFMVEECRRFLNGEPLRYQITREAFHQLA
jgi:phosphoglycerate dehydrogenase-like enzyme